MLDLRPNARADVLGVLTHGSLTGGVEMKLDAALSIEDVAAGTFAVVQGEKYDFFSMITDVRIAATNERILLQPPGREDGLLREILQGSGTYTTVTLKPMLMLPNRTHQELLDEAPRSVKTIPSHFSQVARATEDDVTRVFGSEHNDPRFFHVGEPLGMEGIPVCLDMDRFVERSNAVFGRTGTGKSFLTRLLLCGAIKTGRAVNLVFDMHNEYGSGKHSESGAFARGLQQLFPGQVQVFSLDPESTRRRGGRPDAEVHLYADQVEPADVLPLRDTLDLNPTATESTFQLQRSYGRRWLARLLQTEAADVEAMAEETGAHPASLAALRRKLGRLEGLPFFHLDAPSAGRRDVLDELLEALDAGKSVVLEFGQHNSLLVYLLVANVLTRRLREKYERKAEVYENTQNEADRPRQLLITVEEAHKFLGPETARETPFGKIAREMRKFYVSLLIVDQRPSGIDEEVLSQIGTKMVAALSDEKDIGAALVGTAGASALRQVLASLDSKQQALILGHAVPMPVVVKTRTYDEAFYQAMRGDRPRTFEEERARIAEEFG